jgi:hypothetical protein
VNSHQEAGNRKSETGQGQEQHTPRGVIDSDGFHHLLFLFRESIEQYVFALLSDCKGKITKNLAI